MESTALARNPHLPSLSKSVEEKCDSIKLFSDSSDVESNIGSKKDDNFNHSVRFSKVHIFVVLCFFFIITLHIVWVCALV